MSTPFMPWWAAWACTVNGYEPDPLLAMYHEYLFLLHAADLGHKLGVLTRAPVEAMWH